MFGKGGRDLEVEALAAQEGVSIPVCGEHVW